MAQADETARLPSDKDSKKYELLRHLSTGGMAEVHLARTQGIGGFERLVVIKQILPKLAGQNEFVQMFLDEARIAASLHHSNIVQVYDVGTLEGAYFYAMEFLHGHDARAIMKQSRKRGYRGGIPLEQAIAITLGVCAGLHYAHERVGADGHALGIVHRDISPHNMFVTYDGGVKLIDFGIAKARGRLSAGTEYGTLKGKFGYMSPEQCMGESLDRRTDVFAIAIVLYEMTTGERLYTGGSEYEILKKIVEDDAPPPSSRDRRYPPELERIVLKGLGRKRDQRYQTAQELQRDLDQFARDYGIVSSPMSLARFMEQLFKEEISAWHAAQSAGRVLSDHVMAWERDPDGESSANRRPPPDPLGKTDLAGDYRVRDPHSGAIVNPHTETMMPVPTARPAAARPRRRIWPLVVGILCVCAAASAGVAVKLGLIELPRQLLPGNSPSEQIEQPRTKDPSSAPVFDLGGAGSPTTAPAPPPEPLKEPEPSKPSKPPKRKHRR